MDDAAMEAYLEGNEPDVEALRALIRKARSDRRLLPGSVRLGLQEQGRAAAARRRCRLPAVAARRAGLSRASTGRTTEPATSPRRRRTMRALSMLAFKIMDDPFVGSLTFCRIYSGKLNKGMRC
jgi:elongation factor G